MISLVLDCSFAAAWCFEDEHDTQADRIAESLDEHTFHVPDHWFAELGNMILVAQRKNRLSVEQADRALNGMLGLPIALDPRRRDGRLSTTLELARRERLTFYDACYLELAIDLNVPLATRDRDLSTAARRRGLGVISEHQG